jgi:ABC-2 type transport system permease protein
MNTPLDATTELALEPETTAPVEMQVHPFYWSVRREIWENRSVYLAPLIVAAIVVFASLFGVGTLPGKMRALPADPAARHSVIVRPFGIAPAPIMLTTILVGLFYALDALYGERRDRSILFWKSLPVSDRTAVLAKAAIPTLVLPAIGLILGLAAQWILVALSTLAVLGHGMNPFPIWSEYRFIQEPLVMIYGVAVHALWFAPVYAWLLLVSAWARRMPLLLAVLPAVLVAFLERALFHTSYFVNMLSYRVTGAMTEAFGVHSKGVLDRLSQLEPLRFLAAPGLWTGLLFAAACLAAAVRLRRSREPI